MYRHANNFLLSTTNTNHIRHTMTIKKIFAIFHIIKTFVVFIIVKININILNINKNSLKFKIRESSESTIIRNARKILRKIETTEIINNRRNNNRHNNN
jgi:hypothetical protein